MNNDERANEWINKWENDQNRSSILISDRLFKIKKNKGRLSLQAMLFHTPFFNSLHNSNEQKEHTHDLYSIIYRPPSTQGVASVTHLGGGVHLHIFIGIHMPAVVVHSAVKSEK